MGEGGGHGHHSPSMHIGVSIDCEVELPSSAAATTRHTMRWGIHRRTRCCLPGRRGDAGEWLCCATAGRMRCSG